jgi:hypothetical protein
MGIAGTENWSMPAIARTAAKVKTGFFIG